MWEYGHYWEEQKQSPALFWWTICECMLGVGSPTGHVWVWDMDDIWSLHGLRFNCIWRGISIKESVTQFIRDSIRSGNSIYSHIYRNKLIMSSTLRDLVILVSGKIFKYRRSSARQYPQCVSNGDTAILHKAIDTTQIVGKIIETILNNTTNF